jgi:hypothetical protein
MSSNFAKKREHSGQFTPRKGLLRSSPLDGSSESSNGTGARTSFGSFRASSSLIVLRLVTCVILTRGPFHLRFRLRSLPRLFLPSRFPDYFLVSDFVLVKRLHFLDRRFS